MNNRYENFTDIILQKKIFPKKMNMEFYFEYILDNMEIGEKTVLDIGGGFGVYSFLFALNGAAKVICLEPVGDGSKNNVQEEFEEIKHNIGAENVCFINDSLQNYKPQEKYDIILILNAVNHLNEDACINLLKSENNYNEYLKLFSKLYELLNENGTVIITDCSRYNFFNILKIKNPFSPTIEWEKHQSPNTWMTILSKAGFNFSSLRWTSFNRLGKWGRFLFGNKLFSFFFHSHFKLVVKKQQKNNLIKSI